MLLARKFYERVYNRWIQPRSLPVWSPLTFPRRCVFPVLQRQHFHGRGADAAGRDLILLLRQHRHHPALCCSLRDDLDCAAGKVAITTTTLPALVSSAPPSLYAPPNPRFLDPICMTGILIPQLICVGLPGEREEEGDLE